VIEASGGEMRSLYLLIAGTALSLYAFTARAEGLYYGYDPMGRLVGVVSDSGPNAVSSTIYRYDKADNRNLVVVAKTDATVTPVFRFNHIVDGHFYSLGLLEGISAGYDAEQVAFDLYKSPGAGLIALYRCYNITDKDHFVSTGSTCEGQGTGSLLGYAASASGTGLTQLYRYYKSSIKDHLVTVNSAEAVAGGYTLDASLGYVP
jgi:hypothetical protein